MFSSAAFWIMVMTFCSNRTCYVTVDTFDNQKLCEEKASWVHIEMLRKGQRMKPTCIPSWSALNLEYEK